ncbi:MAG: hypothetical protein H6Q15_2465 [Bacteroidetes bacterium]|nr:hypothetical protein [Bacteroidota bacterium]
MVRLFYTPLKKGGKTSLCLCFKENKTRKYKSLTKYLTGEFFKRNRDAKTKQLFKKVLILKQTIKQWIGQ